MCQPTGAVEGQTLARQVLDAFARDQHPDWESFHRAYQEPLLRAARSRLALLQAQNQYTPEDVLHDFLTRRVYPPDRARSMLGPSARGQRPLQARLLASLQNHCTDLVRRIPPAQPASSWLDQAAAPTATSLPSFDQVEALLDLQVRAIRQACAPRRGRSAPYREALLVRQRLDWSPLNGTTLRAESGARIDLDLARLEASTAWSAEERATRLGEDGATLEQLWERLRPLVEAGSGPALGVEQVAPLVPVSGDVWHQWFSRARRKVQESLGERFAEVFALWASQGGGR